MRRSAVLVLTILLFSLGCADQDDDLAAIKIRIQNTSNLNFDSAQVGDSEHIHMDIAPDNFSEYLGYETAYRYAYIKIVSGDENYVLQPIDFVGETPLSIGFYTYVLDVTEEGNVSLELVTD
ncbi:MAG: hypothetical protein AB8B59_17730 [Maribacter sp.]